MQDKIKQIQSLTITEQDTQEETYSLKTIQHKLIFSLEKTASQLLPSYSREFYQQIQLIKHAHGLDDISEQIKRLVEMLGEALIKEKQVKGIRIRTGERKRYRLLVQDESNANGQFHSVMERLQREIDSKNQEIYKLLQRNRNQQKKLLVISTEYSRNKIDLENEVERLRGLLSNSLANMNEYVQKTVSKPLHRNPSEETFQKMTNQSPNSFRGDFRTQHPASMNYITTPKYDNPPPPYSSNFGI